jgi:transcription antitermination factor NusG
MPILPPEPTLFPQDLLDATDAPAGPSRAWWVLYVRTRQEKSLARQMHALQVPFFLPLMRNPLRIRGKAVDSHVPLFAGYLFLYANREERGAAIATGRVIRCLEVHTQNELWADLRQVHRLLRSGARVGPETRLTPGTPVEIREGPLAGLQGKILRGATGRRFVVQVNFIQQGASVLLDEESLEPLEAAEPVGRGADRLAHDKVLLPV